MNSQSISIHLLLEIIFFKNTYLEKYHSERHGTKRGGHRYPFPISERILQIIWKPFASQFFLKLNYLKNYSSKWNETSGSVSAGLFGFRLRAHKNTSPFFNTSFSYFWISSLHTWFQLKNRWSSGPVLKDLTCGTSYNAMQWRFGSVVLFFLMTVQK